MVILKKVSLALVTAAAIGTMASAYAQTPSAIQVLVDGNQVGQVNWRFDTGINAYVTDFSTFTSGGNYSVNVGQAVYESDPIFSYGVGVTNESAAQKTFRFVYELPFDPNITLPTNVRANLGGTIVDGTGNGVQLTAPSSGSVQTITFSPGNVATAINLGTSFSGPGSATGTQFEYGTFFAPGPTGTDFTSGPAGGAWSGLRVATEFTLSGRDSLSLDGFVVVKPIPEPGPVALLALGLALLALNSKRCSAARKGFGRLAA